jgi:ubiquinone biosynthesis protein COQ4
MSRTASTHLHPIAALRAIRALIRDREDTRQAFLLMDALRGKTSVRQLARFRSTEVGRAVLAERRRLFDRLADRRTLSALPPGTLGRAYYDFMASENLSAEGLATISNLDQLPPGEDMTLFRERTREMHDLLHIVGGYGRDPLGEACVGAFTFAQTGLKGFAVIALFAAMRIGRIFPDQPVRRTVFEAYRRGRRAEWLIAADWENLLDRPLAEIRAQFNIRPSTCYEPTLAAIRAARADPASERAMAA